MPKRTSTPDGEQFLQALTSLNIWKRGDERAPHKPLLVLYALARISRGEPRMVPYAEAMEPLRRLLTEFGPARQTHHPEQPFARLANDGIWELRTERVGHVAEGEPTSRRLLDGGTSGGFLPHFHEALAANPALVQRAATLVLAAHFPETYHDEILTELGFAPALDGEGLEVAGADGDWTFRPRRDPSFRPRVLLAYAFRCAVCDFHLQMDHAPLGLDAAHIHWKQHRGPDAESNGLALCTLHHRLFDRGAFTVDAERRLLVSSHVVGDTLDESLMRFHLEPIHNPREPVHAPAPEHLAWHQREVFREPARSSA